MENATNNKQPASMLLKVYRTLSIAFLILAIAYIVMPYDFDRTGIKGYIDDFFLFMSAFTFMHGSWQRPAFKRVRLLLYQISAIFFVLAVVWVYVLSVM